VLLLIACAPAPDGPAARAETYRVRIVFTDFDERVILNVNDTELVNRVMTTENPDGGGLSAIVDADLRRENSFHLTTSRGVDFEAPVAAGPETRIVYVSRAAIVPSESDTLALE
jgi:hypothetical protein